MQRAQERDAARRNGFFFRRNIFPPDRPSRNYDLASRPVSPPSVDPHAHLPNGHHSEAHGPNGHAAINGTGASTPQRREREGTSSSGCSFVDEQGDEAVE